MAVWLNVEEKKELVTKWSRFNLTKAKIVILSWELIHNPNFNYGEIAIIKSQVGLNN